MPIVCMLDGAGLGIEVESPECNGMEPMNLDWVSAGVTGL